MNSGFFSHWFLAAGYYTHFQISTMLLLQYLILLVATVTHCLIDADTYVSNKEHGFDLKTFLFQNLVLFVIEGATSLCTRAQSNFSVLLFGHKPNFNKRHF